MHWISPLCLFLFQCANVFNAVNLWWDFIQLYILFLFGKCTTNYSGTVVLLHSSCRTEFWVHELCFLIKFRKVYCTNKYLDAQYICTCIGQTSGPEVQRPHRQLNIYYHDFCYVRLYVMCPDHNWLLPTDVELHCCQDSQIKSLEFVYMAWKSVMPVLWFGVRPSRYCKTLTLMNIFLDAINVVCQNFHNGTWCTCWALPVYTTLK